MLLLIVFNLPVEFEDDVDGEAVESESEEFDAEEFDVDGEGVESESDELDAEEFEDDDDRST